MKSRNLCKKKRAQSRSISGRRCSLAWEQDFTQIGGLDRMTRLFTNEDYKNAMK
ncbi:GTP pyrophosphokinase [Caldibacillus debilis]|uniref:GTP pyrophosphokinase n=1 Tax=Caldibacillus debilis TaxID=301148 RepID=A0A150LX95_9BACI|nr:GTP pyrophosphokinase [Caldibacillus debilis]